MSPVIRLGMQTQVPSPFDAQPEPLPQSAPDVIHSPQSNVGIFVVGAVLIVFLVAKGYRWWRTLLLSSNLKDLEFWKPNVGRLFASDVAPDLRNASAHCTSDRQVASDEKDAPHQQDDSCQKDASGYANQPISLDDLVSR